MVPFKDVIGPLTAVLGLAVVLERVLELLSDVWERFLSTREGRKIPGPQKADRVIADLEQQHKMDQQSRAVEQRVEASLDQRMADKKALEQTKQKIAETRAKLQQAQDADERQKLEQSLTQLQSDFQRLKTKLAQDEDQGEWDERFSNAVIFVEDATDPDDGLATKKFIMQLLGFALGIIFVRVAGIQLFNNLGIRIYEWADYLLTGLLIGGGSAPIHFLIRFISEHKTTAMSSIDVAEQSPAAPVEKPPQLGAPTAVVHPADAPGFKWIDIPYNGGVNREKLEYIHKRTHNPDMIVYHHTGMHRDASFEDVVRVVTSRTDAHGNPWVTGSHCVIHASGSIHPFCRWDRYGNHAVGYNFRSLGLSFIGNFETDPAVPYANPDGRMGVPSPTEEQLKAGARVVTLWSFLYDIKLDFEKTIIPHHQVSSKSCPGSAFPYDEFKKWIEYYRNHWEKSEEIQQQIEIFRHKSYLYI